MQFSKVIHSTSTRSSKQQKQDACNGLWNTLVNCSSTAELFKYVQGSSKVMNNIIPKIVNNSVSVFEKSSENILRSLSVFYSEGLLSRRKYESIARNEANSYAKASIKLKKSVQKVRRVYGRKYRIPRLLEYKKVAKFIQDKDIGELHNVPQAKEGEFSDDNVGVGALLIPPVEGFYRDLETYLIEIADLYLFLNEKEILDLDWFEQPVGSFKVAIGADGAPFGKQNEATSWLISFLNVGERVASCNDNFILLGANCPEDHPNMKKYAVMLSNQFPEIESKQYTIRGIQCSFEFDLIPADQKWLATFSGELNNASSYPSSFANVSLDDMSTVNGSIGNSPNDTWHSWGYSERLDTVRSVSKKKKGKSLKRPVVTKYIAGLKSRQEFKPLLGPVIQKAKCEPLHLANNCWQLWFKEIFGIALGMTDIANSVKDIADLDPLCPLIVFLEVLKSTVRAKNLYNKICRWFKEKSASSDFNKRFTGEETKKMCHSYMHLVLALYSVKQIHVQTQVQLFALAYTGTKLRDATSLFNRIKKIDQAGINKLKVDCTMYFNAVKVFFHVTLSVWTVGYCVPLHCQQLFDKYKCGLGLNTMQGREAKHQSIKAYASHSTYANRWQKVFQHEYMQLVWMRKENTFTDNYSKCKDTYIPEHVNEPGYCYCGLAKDDCFFCNSKLMREIDASAHKGELTQTASAVLDGTEV